MEVVEVVEDHLLDHEGRDPADLALIGDDEERRVPHEIISEMSRHVIEEENVRGPDLAGRQLQPGAAAVLLRVPLEVVVLPGQVQPDEAGEDSLQHSVTPPLPSTPPPHLARLHIDDLLKVGLDKNSLDLLSGVGGDDGDEERVVALQQVLVEPVLGRLSTGEAQQRDRDQQEGKHLGWLAGLARQTIGSQLSAPAGI